MVATVSIIGAGPGDPGLITVRGLAAARRADAIIYDALIDARLLASLGPAERHPVGDRRHSDEARMLRLGELYRRLSERGLRIARLKGGDSMLFARIAEELALLDALAVSYEIIPGVTAALAAAAYAEVPLTVRGQAQSVALLTGHQTLPTTPAADTLAIYMGGTRCRQLCAELIERGWEAATPAVAVARATLPGQRTVAANLAEFAAGEAAPPSSPMLLIVGSVCARAPQSSWYERRPRILVTGTSSSRYQAYGEVIHAPLIETAEPTEPGPLQEAVAQIDSYAWVVFTSRMAVAAVLDRLLERSDTRLLAGVRLATIGSETNAALRRYGLRADLTPAEESSEALGLAVARLRQAAPAERVLLPRSDLASPALPESLRAAGFLVEAVTAYRTLLPPEPIRIELEQVDVVTFASPSAVHNFVAVYGSDFPVDAVAVVRGEATAGAVDAALGDIRRLSLEQLRGWLPPRR